MKIMITGGAGYIGTMLVPLLALDNEVIIYDLLLYDNKVIWPHGVKTIRADIRDIDTFSKEVRGVDVVYHLASISNDPSYELNPELGKSINYYCFPDILEACKDVKRFIFASSASVYGVKDELNVTEESLPEPITDYSKYKWECEKLLFDSDIPIKTAVRCATVCGFSPRMRFDLSVNILTAHAMVNGVIKVFGGKQRRPNINILDVINFYRDMLTYPDIVDKEVFNLSYQNNTMDELADIVQNTVKSCADKDVVIEHVPTDDLRSYHIDSSKISKMLGFELKYDISSAVSVVVGSFKEGLIHDALNNTDYHNVKLMKEIQLE